MEYIFDDGARLIMDGRCMVGCHRSTPASRTAPRARRSRPSRATAGTPSSIYTGQNPDRANMIWQSERRCRPAQSLRQNEWNDLVDAIRNDRALQRGGPVVSWPAWLVRWVGRLPIPASRDHIRRDAQLRPRIRAGCGAPGRWIRPPRSKPVPTASTRSRSRVSSPAGSTEAQLPREKKT